MERTAFFTSFRSSNITLYGRWTECTLAFKQYKSAFAVGLGRGKNMHQDELLCLID